MHRAAIINATIEVLEAASVATIAELIAIGGAVTALLLWAGIGTGAI